MCPSAPRVCSEPGGQKLVLPLSPDLIGAVSHYVMIWYWAILVCHWGNHIITPVQLKQQLSKQNDTDYERVL